MIYSSLFSILYLVINSLTSIFVPLKDRGMEKKWYVTYFLLFISIVMLVVPVIPHHHHADGLICMKNDITTDCCKQNHNPENDHCCSDTGCVTTHFFQRSPSTDNDAWANPDTLWVATFYLEPLLRLLAVPEVNLKRQDNVYLESLHGTFITRATGLRAPPSVLA